MAFSKLSIFLLYFRIFEIHRPTRIAIYAGMISTIFIYTPAIALQSALCVPAPGKDWSSVDEEQCDRIIVWGVIAGTLGVVQDIYIFIIPIPILLGLQMPKAKKIGTMVIFGTAIL